jgi:hypothetical protein
MSSTADISWQWADYQRDARDELEAGDVDLVVLRTGYGGGKSITGAQWIHRGALTDGAGESKSLVLAQDYAKGKSTTYSVFFETLPGDDTNPFEDGDPENSPIVATWHQNDKRLTYITGHTAFLGGADKWSRFAGAEFCRIWCDEVGHYPPQTDLYRLHEMLVTRQRTDAGPNTTLWTSTGNGFNQFYDITERQVDRDGEELAWRDRMTVIQASTEDNPFLPDGALDKIRSQFVGTERVEQGLHGGFAAAEGLVYDRFSRQTHVKSQSWLQDHVDWNAPPIYGYDAGWNHPRVLVQWRPTHADQWAATRLYYVTDKEFGHLCDPSDGTGWVYEQDIERGRLYAEHEPEHIQKFDRAGFDAVKANKSLDEGIPHVRGLLETDDTGRPGLVVGDGLTELIQEFQSYKEDHVGSSRDVPDHAMDALRYALFTHTPTDNDRGDSSGISYL